MEALQQDALLKGAAEQRGGRSSYRRDGRVATVRFSGELRTTAMVAMASNSGADLGLPTLLARPVVGAG